MQVNVAPCEPGEDKERDGRGVGGGAETRDEGHTPKQSLGLDMRSGGVYG